MGRYHNERDMSTKSNDAWLSGKRSPTSSMAQRTDVVGAFRCLLFERVARADLDNLIGGFSDISFFAESACSVPRGSVICPAEQVSARHESEVSGERMNKVKKYLSILFGALLFQLVTCVALWAGTTGIRYFQGKPVDDLFDNKITASLAICSFLAGMIAPLSVLLGQVFSNKPVKIEGVESTRIDWVFFAMVHLLFMILVILAVMKLKITPLMLFWG